MAHLIDKDALVAEIERRKHKLLDHIICESDKEWVVRTAHQLNRILLFIDTLEVKEVDFNALGVLAEHLIACDAHLVTPKYTDKELNLLEELAKNNKAQKGE